MDVGEARDVLGVGRDASTVEVRAAFRRLVRQHHPDRAGAAGNDATVRLVAAYRLLRTAVPVAQPGSARPSPAPAPPPRPRPRPRRERVAPDFAVWIDGDTVVAGLPAQELFSRLVDVGHGLGEVAYVDAGAGLLEVVIEFLEYPVCSVVLSLQGRSNETTEAFVTVEPLGGGRGPGADAVAMLFAARLVAAATAVRR
ncbi:MAG: J domain-containing protein [Acidimicrobiia bacterium]